MKNIALIILITLGFSCNSVKQEESKPIIQLTKKRCLGKCPVYDVFVNKDGLLRYSGIANVDKKGIYQFKISEDKLEELEKLFDNSQFKELIQTEIKGRDLPITQLSYQNKMISFQNQDIPEKVKDIIKEIERIVGI